MVSGKYLILSFSFTEKQDISTSDSTKGRECQPQDAVVIDFVGRLANNRDDEDGPIFQEANDCLIVVGEKFVCPALEMGVRFMHVGQRAVIWAHSKFAHGLSTRKYNGFELPPNSNVRYEIVLKSIYSPEEESADPDGFQISLALSKKQLANDIFKNELSSSSSGGEQRALRLYSKAAEEMLHLIQSYKTNKEGDASNEDDREKKREQAYEIMLDCLNNIVAVHMKSKNYHEAKESAVKVLSQDPNNFKALLRAARAAMLDPSGTYEEAELALVAAEEVVKSKELDDKEIRKLRAELRQQKQQYKKRQKDMATRMQEGIKRQLESESHNSRSESHERQPESQNNEGSEDFDAKDQAAEVSQSADGSLMSKLLPWALQIIIPLVLYVIVVSVSKKPAVSYTEGSLGRKTAGEL